MMVQEIGLRGRMDLASFNSGVQSFMKSIRDMNKEVTNVAKETTAGAKSAGESIGFLGVNWQRVKDIVSGLVVIDVFRQISRGLKSITADALDATAVFQSLQITMTAIIARDFAKEFGVPVSKALVEVSGKAEELIDWIRMVAVTSPFSVESLGSALAYGQAFGFNVQQAKRLTIATGEFTAGMGLTDLHMSRIIYNFGQMLASGRVLGRELRDLANNFVPIRDITQMLADEAGMTFDEMKKGMKESQVTAAQFIGAFVRMAETDFAGAMGRMARTIRGVQQNISDFIRTLFGLELLGPVMKRVAELSADALDAAFSPETIRAFTILGEVLLDAFERIRANITIYLIPAIKDFFGALGIGAPTVMDVASALVFMSEAVIKLIRAVSSVTGKIADFINSLSDKFGATFADVAKNAASWGGVIVKSLAAGMAQAVTYIIQVLQAIARIFTYWLRGSSPPKLLPDLTKWGQQAMEAWLEGWTSADFGLFNDIASVVTSFIRSIAHTIPEANLIPRIIGARGAIERAVNEIRKFGTITDSTMKRIVNSVGSASEAMRNFVRETFEFAQISGIVKAAKKLLDFDIEFNVPTKILGQTVSSLRDLGKLARRFRGALGEALRGYVDALGDAERANKRVAKEQANLNAITEKYERALNKLSILQDKLRKKQDFTGRVRQIEAALATGLLTDEEKRRLELEKEEIILTHRITALENERDVAVDSAKVRLDAEQAIADEAESRLERQRRLATLLADEQLAAAKEQLDAARALIDMQIEHNNLIQEQIKTLERLAKGAAGETDMGLGAFDFEGFEESFESSLMASKEEIAAAINDLRADIRAQMDAFIAELTAPFEGIPERLSALLAEIGAIFTTAKDNTAIQQFVVSLQNFGIDVSTALGNLKTFWEENGPGILETIGGFFEELGKVLKPEFEGLLINLGLGIESFGESLVAMSENLVEKGPEIQESIQGWVDWVFEEGIPKIQDFGKTLREDIVPAVKDFAGIIKDNAPTIIAILTALGAAFLALRPALVILTVLSKVGLALIPLTIIFQTLASAAGGLVGVLSFLGGILTTVLGGLGSILAGVSAPLIAIGLLVGGVLVGQFLALRDNVLGLRDLLVNSFKAIGKTLKPVLKPLQKAFKDLGPSLKKLLQALAPVGKLLLGALKAVGTVILAIVIPAISILLGVITGLISGIARGLTFFLQGLRTVIEGITNIITGVVTFFQGLWDVIVGVFTGDSARFKAGVVKAFSGIGQVLLGIFQTIVGAVEGIIGFVFGLFAGFLTGVTSFIANLIGSFDVADKIAKTWAGLITFFSDASKDFSEWITGLVTTLTEKIPEWLTAGGDYVINLIQGIKDNVFGEDGLIAKVGQWIADTITKAREYLSDFLTAGQDFITELIAGIRQNFEGALGLWAKFKQWILDTLNAIDDIKDDLIQAGIDLIAGIIEGLWQKATDLYDTVASIIKNALGIAEEESESKSESKRMKRLGEDWMAGLARGISEGATGVENAMGTVFSDLLSIPEDMQLDFAGIASELDSLSNLGGGLDVRHLMEPTRGAGTTLTQPSPTQTTIQNLNVEVNAAYSEVQSEASIYYDVQAALAHITR